MPPPVPDHDLLRLIGRGSYGEVWLARSLLGAWRAVKFVRRDTFGSERPFEREFSGIQRYEPVSRSADGLVPILHVGRNAEGFFYVMELADGVGEAMSLDPAALDPETYAPRTLRSDLKRLGRLPVAECLELGLALAAGLSHLHRQGLIHRDIKPSNLIFVNGRAKLADLGLVGGVDEARSFVGTIGYIPPEGPGTIGADIFALGRVLYEAATGLSPDEFPNPPPDWLTGDIPHGALELHEIILRACETDPARRYPSAVALQADLALLQSGQSVRTARKLERRVKTLRRAGIIAGLAVLLATGGGIFASYLARTEHDNAARAQALLHRAEAAEHVAQLQLAEAQLVRAGLERRSGLAGQRFHTLELIRQAAAVSTNRVELRTEAIAARALPDFRETRARAIGGPPGQWCVASPAFDRYTQAHLAGPVRIHAWPEDQELALLEGADIRGLLVRSFSADGSRVEGQREETAFVWNTADGHQVFERTVPGLRATGLAPDGKSIAFHLTNGILQRVSLAEGTEAGRLDTGFADGGFRFSPDGRRLAFFSPSRGEVRVFDVAGRAHPPLQLPSPACPSGLLWTPDSEGLLIAGDDYRAYLFQPTRPGLGIVRLEGHQAEMIGLATHPSQPFAISSSWDGTTRLWNLETGQQLLRVNRRGAELRWRADGHLGWVEDEGGGRFRLAEFEVALPVGLRVLAEPVPPRPSFANKGTWDAVFLAAGNVLAVASYDGVRLWPVAGGEPHLLPLGQTRWLETDAGGTALWLSTAEQILRVPLRWDGVGHRLLIGTPQAVGAVGRELPLAGVTGTESFSARGHQLLQITAAGTRSAGDLPDETTRLQASADGRWLLAGEYQSDELQLLATADARLVRRLRPEGRVRGLFLAGGDDLLISNGTALRREHSADGQPRWTVSRADPGGSSGPMAVTPDGRILAATLSPREVALLDADTGEVWCRLETPEPGEVVALRFSPTGQHLAVATANHTVLLWDLTAVRTGLRELKLDWSVSPLAPAASAGPVTFGPLETNVVP